MNTKSLYLSLNVFSLFFCHHSMAGEVGQAVNPLIIQETLSLELRSRQMPSIAAKEPSRDPVSTTNIISRSTITSLKESARSYDRYLDTEDSFSGLYVIGSVGHSHLSAPRKGILTLATNPNVGAQTGASLSSNHAILSAGMGCGSLINRFVSVGIEILGFWDGHDKRSETTFSVGPATLSLTENLVKKIGWEARGKLGYLPNDKLCIYAGLGVEQTSFSYDYVTNSTLSGKVSKNLWGVSPLAGMRAVLTEKLSLDFMYQYTLYQGMSIRSASGNGSQFYRSLKPSNSIAQVGLTYKIN